MSTTLPRHQRIETFRHDALFYSGLTDFVDRTATFIGDSIAADEPILVFVSQEKIDLLRSRLGDDSNRVRYLDMAGVGRNPACIIPAWKDFVAESTAGGTRARGIGEPIWAERTADELIECQRHESLLNLAFDGAPAWWLVCPYDTQGLARDVLDEAWRSHAIVQKAGTERRSKKFRDLATVARPFDVPLADLGIPAGELSFGAGQLEGVRRFIAGFAAAAGFRPSQSADAVLAANELATNSLRHASGHGVLRVWHRAGTLILEVADEGHIDLPLVGRERPRPGQEGGLGLWLVNHICDLVQIRSFSNGAIVRVHLARR